MAEVNAEPKSQKSKERKEKKSKKHQAQEQSADSEHDSAIVSKKSKKERKENKEKKDRTEKTDKAGRTGKKDKMVKVDKLEEVIKTEQTQQMDKKDKMDKNDKTERKDKKDKTEKKKKKEKRIQEGDGVNGIVKLEGNPAAEVKQSKKRKRDQVESEAPQVYSTPHEGVDTNAESSIKEKKKRKKQKKHVNQNSNEGLEASITADSATETQETQTNARAIEPLESQEDYAKSERTKNRRFIAFIGNLPFTATKEDVAKHFKSIEPASIRLISHKDTGNSKGFAFIEFDRFDHMKSCLKLYHHSSFNDGKSPPRKINVELTAGGGGSNANRTQKIQEKNEKLREERKKNIRKDEAEKKQRQSGTADHSKEQPQEASNGMHPSRLARLQR